MEIGNMSFFPSVIAILLLQFLSIASATRTFNEEFTYKGKHTGPGQWGQLHSEWALCNTGHRQSPIDLYGNQMLDRKLVDLKRQYKPARATVTNRGQDIMVHWEEPSGGFMYNGTEFFLQQLHWHKPSEHRVNGQRFDIEMHMVHQSVERKFAVITGLYKMGGPDPFLTKLESYIDDVKSQKNKKVDAGIIDPSDTGLNDTEFYRYIGSLTTPPCSQGVVWTIMTEVKNVSREQVHMLRVATPSFHENARPIQKTENRTIMYYHPM